MRVRRIVPDLAAERVAESRDFYAELFGLEVVMDLDWIVTLRAPGTEIAQLSLITQDATAVVRPNLTIEVEDVDVVHAAALKRGAEIAHPLTDEPWGVRRFFVRDPGGAFINVMGHPSKADDAAWPHSS
jgi:catechol 2,3-dioxygenase-like lactoylglutathione lyase family enzyme